MLDLTVTTKGHHWNFPEPVQSSTLQPTSLKSILILYCMKDGIHKKVYRSSFRKSQFNTGMTIMMKITIVNLALL
jgi:hypothetical protein